jgi:hypothetical protein
MDRLRTAKPWTVACLAVGALSLPALAAADQQPQPPTGGTAAPTDPAPVVAQPLTAPPTGPDTLASSGGVAGHPQLVQGQLGSFDGGARVVVQVQDASIGTWSTVATTKAAAGGGFAVRWISKLPGVFTLRAVRAASAAEVTPADVATGQFELYRSTVASWFGPGNYGHQTACGQMMTPQLLGVAHLKLPCGTLVDIAYHGRKLTVPVVDRGPYVSGVSFDLTAATAQALGVTETVHLGTLTR